MHRCAPVEEAVAEAETRLDQGVPRLGSTDAIDPQAAKVLECLNRGARTVAEHPVLVEGTTAVEDGGQSVLDVRDGRPGVPERQGKDYRYSAISWSS
jgi:hypothetical protein